jgi:RNase P subunit RPR2
MVREPRDMVEPPPRLPMCPDCGGILQPIRTERVTSAEVASADEDTRVVVSQCLICGYTEARPVERPAGERPALA